MRDPGKDSMADDEAPTEPVPALPPRVRIKDVARHAGVSVTTVSNVLNQTNRISQRTQDRVHAAIRELGYVRNAAAQQLRVGRSDTIGLIVPDGSNPFYAAIARGAEDAAQERDSSVLLGNSNQDPQREAHYIKLFEEHRVQGLLIAPISDVTERIETLRHRGIRAVVVGRVAHPEGCSSVSIDNIAGGYLATKHLLDSGRRTIAFVGPTATPGVRERLEGAHRAIAEHPTGTLEVIEEHDLTVAAGRHVGTQLTGRPRHRLPDGVFCANDLLATGVLHAFLTTSTIRVPEQTAIIGYDDIDFAQSAIVPLSSIRQPAELIGHTAVELLNHELDNPTARHRHVLFPPELVARRSTLAQAEAVH